MVSVYVYEAHQGFRVVIGDHTRHTSDVGVSAGAVAARIYNHNTRPQALARAYAGESNRDIKHAISRMARVFE